MTKTDDEIRVEARKTIRARLRANGHGDVADKITDAELDRLPEVQFARLHVALQRLAAELAAPFRRLAKRFDAKEKGT